MAELNDWDVVDANNNAAPPNGWPEGMNYSEVNNTGRADQGKIKRWFADIGGSLITAGSANTYTLTLNAAYTALFDGLFFRTSFNVANTGAVTLNVNGIGATTVQDRDGNALVADDIVTGAVYDVMYDGTVFRLLNVFGAIGGADVITTAGGQTIGGTLEVTGTLTLGAGLDAVGAITSDALTADRALISGVGGLIEVSTVTETELGYVSGVTSAIQTQLDAKIDDSGTTTGTLLRWSGTAWQEYTSGPIIQGADTIQSVGLFLKLGTPTDPDALWIDDNRIFPVITGGMTLGDTSNRFSALLLSECTINSGANGVNMESLEPDSATAKAFTLRSNASYSTAGARLFEVQNQASTRMYVTYDGDLFVSKDLVPSGELLFSASGSAGTPLVSRVSDPDTGIYFSATNEMSVATAGAQRLKFEANGTLVVTTANYETLVTADDDIPNKKWVDDNTGMVESASSPYTMPAGTANTFDITDVPTGCKKVTIVYNQVTDVSTNTNYGLRLGDSTSIKTSGYSGSGAMVTGTNTCKIGSPTTYAGITAGSTGTSVAVLKGEVTIERANPTNFDYVVTAVISDTGNGEVSTCTSRISLTSELTRFQIYCATNLNGGEVAVYYQ